MPGADSVAGLPGARLNYSENAVYSNSACLPTHLVFYTYTPRLMSSALWRTQCLRVLTGQIRLTGYFAFD